MEKEGSSSIERGLFARRHTLTAHKLLSVPSRNDIFTSSLPSSVLRSELRSKMSRPRSPIINRILAENEDSMDEKRLLNQSFSEELSLPKTRPRSASLHTNQLTPPTSSFKRTLRTMSGRGRPSSARTASKSRSGSLSIDPETKSITNQVETTFATVRKQLTELSAEDTVLQERVKKLSSEIAAMQRYVIAAKSSKKRLGTLPIVSGKHSPLSRDSWEEIDGIKIPEEDGVFQSHHLSLMANCSNGNDSLGSCSGSLADSEGSMSSPSTPLSIIIVDHDKGLPVTPTSILGGPRKSISGYEDDVFLS